MALNNYFTPPVLPKELTRTHWDQNKGNWYKLHGQTQGKTGLGNQLDKMEKARKKIKWSVFEEVRNIPAKELSVKEIDRRCKNMMEHHVKKCPVRDFVKECHELGSTAELVAKKFKGKKTCPKSTRILIETMGKHATSLAVTLGPATMEMEFSQHKKLKIDDAAKFCTFSIMALKSAVKKHKTTAGNLVNTAGAVVKLAQTKGPDSPVARKGLENLVKMMNEEVRDACRDLTQAVGNVARYKLQLGFDVQGVEVNAATKIVKVLEVWGNAQGGKVYLEKDIPDLTLEQVQMDLARFDSCVTACEIMAKKVKFVT